MLQHTLDRLPSGASATVRSLRMLPAAYRLRLQSMGLLPNKLITLLRRAPFGDTIQVKIGNCQISLRQSEAVGIELDPFKH